MRKQILLRWSVLRQIIRRPKVNIPFILAAVWHLSGRYDLFAAQWAPEWLRPVLQPVANMLAAAWNSVGWWLFVALLAVSFLGVFEFAVGQERKIRELDWRRRIAGSGAWNLPFYRRAPIVWSDLDHFLAYTVFPRDSDQPTRISRFQLLGTSRKKHPVCIKEAFIRSLVIDPNNSEGERINAKIEGSTPNRATTVDGGVSFRVIADFVGLDGHIAGPTIMEFRKRFAYFKFVLRTDCGDFEQEFTREDVDAYLVPLVKSFEWGAAGERRMRGISEAEVGATNSQS